MQTSYRLTTVLLALPALLACGAAEGMSAAPARADDFAYLVNVTVRPGYNFASPENALAYGHGICDHVAQGRSYTDVLGDIKNDFGTSDDYQASYLVDQAVNELCPAQIWQLRNSAATYRPPNP